MASCCRAEPCEHIFDWRVAAWDLRAHRRRGLPKLERELLATVPTVAYRDGRVLEIGGGIGALQAELLRRGAASGETVELVGAYEPYAAQLADDLGVSDRTTFRVLDLIADPTATQPADVVLLNKVICCSRDGLELVGVAAALTRKVLVLSYPRYTWLSRLAAGAQHLLFRALGRKYRMYVRPTADVARAATAAGLEPSARGRGFVWEHAAFVRP